MSIVVTKKKFSTFAVLSSALISIFIYGVLFNTQTTYASDATVKTSSCAGSFDSTGEQSPFSQTNGMCLGSGSNGIEFYQFAVKLPSAITNANISAKAGNTTISFVKQSDTLYVSKAGSNYAGMGYGAFTTTNCNKADASNIVTITAAGNSKTQTIVLNLCDNVGNSKALIYTTANGLTGDNGSTSQKGWILGNLGVFRDGAPVGNTYQYGTLEKDGVTSITLTGPTSESGNNASNWYTLSGGNLKIDNLDPGTYNLAIVYNDKSQATAFPAEWASGSTNIGFNHIVVVAGAGTTIGNKDHSIQYYNAAGTVVTTTSTKTSDTGSCGSHVSGIGWIICPVISALGGLDDAMWGSVVSNLLNVNPLTQSSTIYTAWGVIRNLANVVFVIIFLIMIFSQLSNIGISNYGIKKLLPRLIISAILVNISFIIMQISVDLANIIGSSLYDLLLSLVPANSLTWSGLIGLILSTAAAGALTVAGVALVGGVAAAFWMLLPFLAMSALALLAAVLTLIFRTAVIPILAVVAPLAFVAYLLPNTESWFKKWRGLFMSMLLLYPLAALVFGGAQLAANIIVANGGWWNTLIGLIVLTLPLFSLPLLAAKSGALVSSVGGALNGITNRFKSPISKLSGEYTDREKAKSENRAMNSTNKFNPRRTYLQYRARTKAIGQNQQSELNRTQSQYIADQAEANDKFRGQLSQGGGAGADRIALANAINTTAELGAKEIKATRAVIDHMGLSSTQKIQLAQGGPARDANGDPLKNKSGGELISGADANVREAAIASAVSTATVEEVEKIIMSSGGAHPMNGSQRRTLVSSMISSGIPSKAVHLGGPTLGEIEQGILDVVEDPVTHIKTTRTVEEGIDAATKRAIIGGKYSAEKIADNDPASLKRIKKVLDSIPDRVINNASTADDRKEMAGKLNMIAQLNTATNDSRINTRTTDAQKEVINSILHPKPNGQP